jgi:hypothetical protein
MIVVQMSGKREINRTQAADLWVLPTMSVYPQVCEDFRVRPISSAWSTASTIVPILISHE